MKKNFCFLLLLCCLIPAAFAQLHSFSFEEIDSLQRIEKRKTIIFIQTDWCQFCHAMKNTTFKNEEIIKELNKLQQKNGNISLKIKNNKS